MMKLNTSIFVTVFCLFFLSSSFVSGTTLSQNGDFPNYNDTRTSMEVDSDIVWLRVEGDNFFTIDKNANFISYEIISGNVTKTVDLKDISHNLEQYTDFCPHVIGRDPETGGRERSFDCLVVNGDFSPDLSRLYLSICLGDTAGVTEDNTWGLGELSITVIVQKICEFVTLDKEFNILTKSFSENNYSVTYRTHKATYRVYSNFTIENMETGAIGQIPNFFENKFPGQRLEIVPPYILPNSTVVVRYYSELGTNKHVFYEMSGENNSMIEFQQILVYDADYNIRAVQGFDSVNYCLSSSYNSPMQAPLMSWYEDTHYDRVIETIIHQRSNPEAQEYLNKTVIIPEWFMTRLDSIYCFPVDSAETYNHCWEIKDEITNCRIEAYFVPFDFSGEQLVYRRNVITQCTIEYNTDPWMPPKIWSCGIHDGVVYSWDSEQESEEDFPYFGLCCFLLLILVAALGSIEEENQATETITKGKSKRTRKKKQKTYAGTGLTAEEVLEQVDDPLLQVLILSEGKIKSPVLEHSAPTKKEYARRCAYCKRRISGRWGVDVCDDCHHQWETDD